MSDFTFRPVVVNRGRKFRGPAFQLDGGYESRFGYAGSGVCPLTITFKAKLWDPLAKKVAYVNEAYLEDRPMDLEELAKAKEQYAVDTIKSTLDWCMSKSNNELEGRRFARNCLLKNHFELKAYIDKALPDERDVVAAVENVIRWAMSIKRKYRGKTIPIDKEDMSHKAWTVLCRQGYDKLDGFDETWKFMTGVFGLPA